ncbi:acyl-[acyl-carrier-protein]--UDP-N-acetylglucosamine O-acyltransferase [Oxalicibacterium flavum]|uniref:Acyl-[acyl-carrier-protein]--UDP-N-acetylglucosamine O-acyltransferase n=1 Tax=Oxalicibacterium flavum TaxID=179467 RepID=A0A8J2XWZ3_9BURK|nr:acyl-ACP--UDP-N-acetylglucosamine O-acyltransferase [Oxalicibacterium flavum]GGC03002.1 acyl-[acyl-carrier-protein]--UDP-N-acetylglucosamine O-acyltransferase [Oxalicibacterium flavum]
MAIHPTALVDPAAKVDASVEIGAYTVVGPHVQIGAGTRIGPHVVIEGHTTIGRDNHIFQFASIGAAPQDKKYAGEPTQLIIGDGNTIREFVTINLGTVQDGGITRLGSNNWIMAYVHIAHDCQLGDNIILANNATLAGHVHLGDWVFLGGFTSVHQFCHIGAHAMTAFTAAVSQDVPPFVTAAGNRAAPAGINSEGLKRRGFSSEQIAAIKRGYRIVYRSGLPLDEAKAALQQEEQKSPDAAAYLKQLREFIDASPRGIIR